MDTQKVQLADRIKEANNVLVTVSANPSVDQLAAAIGLTLMLNKLGKHGTAVYSGKTPDTLEFLQPAQTLEDNTDSLRDFIISLDKSKADKLRYKVEDQHVKIFITPYRVSINENDLEFSQGDFNVDIVIALGVHEQNDLDQAITAHGRILHDATVSSINTAPGGELGTINWVGTDASSLCEMVADLSVMLKDGILDEQTSTALLTGIVAETDRFSNEKTTSVTMNISARLMAAGANQQLVATKLQEKPKDEDEIGQFDPLAINELAHEEEAASDSASVDQPAADGSLQIGHEDEPAPAVPQTETDQPAAEPQPNAEQAPEADVHPHEIHVDDHGTLRDYRDAPTPAPEADDKKEPSRLILQPPTLGGTLTASGQADALEPSTDPLSVAPADQQPLLSRDAPATEPVEPVPAPTPAPGTVSQASVPDAQTTDENKQTLTDIEQSVDSPHIAAASVAIDAEATPGLDQARDAVLDAITSPEAPAPSTVAELPSVDPTTEVSLPPVSVAPDFNMNLPSELFDENGTMPIDHSATTVEDPTAPPPVPPPMMPPLPGLDDLPQPGTDQNQR